MKVTHAQAIVDNYVACCPKCGFEFSFEFDLMGETEETICLTCDRCGDVYKVILDP